MPDPKDEFEQYGSFHEDLIVGMEQNSDGLILTIQRRKLADTIKDQTPIRNAKLSCRGVRKFEANERRVIIEFEAFTSENEFDIEIVDIVLTVNGPEARVEIFWEGWIDDQWYRDAKFDIHANDISLEFSDLATNPPDN